MKTEEKGLVFGGYTLLVVGLAATLTVTTYKISDLQNELDALRSEVNTSLEDTERRCDERLQKAREELENDISAAREDIEGVKSTNRNTIGALSRMNRRFNDWLEGAKSEKEAVGGEFTTSDISNGNLAALATSESQIESTVDAGYEAPGDEGSAGVYELTAYEWTGNPCANGNYPTEGYTVASNYFPIGTRLYIEGLGEFVVEDTGGMSSNVIDIYMGDVESCMQFGRQSAEVYVID